LGNLPTPKPTELTPADSTEPTAESASTELEPTVIVAKAQQPTEPEAAAKPSEPAVTSPIIDTAPEESVERTVDENQGVPENINEEPRPATANQSISSTSLVPRKRVNILKTIWRAIFINFLGGLFATFRRRERPRQ
jgi:hypothetical protein